MTTLLPHQAQWQQDFLAEAARIRQLLGARALRVEHVGSTAVPGLRAKPVIDIQVSVASLTARDELAALLSLLGYVHVNLGDFDLVYPFFTKPSIWPCSHHLHLCEAGSPQERDHLAFRDYLRTQASAAAAYEQLKTTLAARHDGTTLESQERYSLAKGEFIQQALAKAHQLGLPFPASIEPQ